MTHGRQRERPAFSALYTWKLGLNDFPQQDIEPMNNFLHDEPLQDLVRNVSHVQGNYFVTKIIRNQY